MSIRRIIHALERCCLAVGAVIGAAAGLCAGEARADDIVLNFLNVQADTTYTLAIQEFEKTHPGIKIREQKVPFDQLNPQVQARIGSGDTSVDLYDADPPRISALQAKGLLADLSSVKDQVDKALLPATIVPAIVAGKLYAIPRATSMVLMYYNKDLLQKAGVDFPSGRPRQTHDLGGRPRRRQEGAGGRRQMGDRARADRPLLPASAAL